MRAVQDSRQQLVRVPPVAAVLYTSLHSEHAPLPRKLFFPSLPCSLLTSVISPCDGEEQGCSLCLLGRLILLLETGWCRPSQTWPHGSLSKFDGGGTGRVLVRILEQTPRRSAPAFAVQSSFSAVA